MPAARHEAPVRAVGDPAELVAAAHDLAIVATEADDGIRAVLSRSKGAKFELPLWRRRFQSSGLAVLLAALQTVRGARAALSQEGLVDALYRLALSPLAADRGRSGVASAAFSGFQHSHALADRYMVVEARLAEMRQGLIADSAAVKRTEAAAQQLAGAAAGDSTGPIDAADSNDGRSTPTGAADEDSGS